MIWQKALLYKKNSIFDAIKNLEETAIQIILVVDSNKHHKHPHPSPNPSHPSHPHKKGHDVDKHGCNKSAGYTYCKKTKKCIRPWEENC